MTNNKLISENKILREALEEYADVSSYPEVDVRLSNGQIIKRRGLGYIGPGLAQDALKTIKAMNNDKS